MTAPPATPSSRTVAPPVIRPAPPAPVTASATMMGGTVLVQLFDDGDPTRLEAAAHGVLRRMAAWAGRLTRFSADSELSRLNVSPLPRVPIGPTLTAVLDWARQAEGLSDGVVDVALLDARLEAELGVGPAGPRPATRRWSIERGPREAAVRREPGVRFDLDGVAKGWLADRALDLVHARSALVDGDGDIALRVGPWDTWTIGISDPRDPRARLGVLSFAGMADRSSRFGLATSGTSVHRWAHPGGTTHHLIDPWTGRPAATDVVQATALARTAREAEVYAKTSVILGSGRAFATLGPNPAVLGLLLLTDRGEIRATPGLLQWLA